MNQLLVRLFLAGFLLAIGSCRQEKPEARSPYPPDYFRKEITKLQEANVPADVEASLAKGDHRFLLLVGWGGSVPGVTWNDEMRKKYGTRILDGTGDMIFGKDHERYKIVAAGYAERYNKLLWERIRDAERRRTDPTHPSRPRRNSVAPDGPR